MSYTRAYLSALIDTEDHFEPEARLLDSGLVQVNLSPPSGAEFATRDAAWCRKAAAAFARAAELIEDGTP